MLFRSITDPYPGADCYAGSPYKSDIGCLKPGTVILLKVIVSVEGLSTEAGYPCHGFTWVLKANGTEIARRSYDYPGAYMQAYTSYENAYDCPVRYTIPDWGTYNFCAEIISVR